jgi:uncharacterized protein (DUF433 family)
MTMTAPWMARIHHDPAIMAGKAVVAGTRVPVATVLRRLAAGATRSEVLADWPQLCDQDIEACLLYAATEIDHVVDVA